MTFESTRVMTSSVTHNLLITKGKGPKRVVTRGAPVSGTCTAGQKKVTQCTIGGCTFEGDFHKSHFVKVHLSSVLAPYETEAQSASLFLNRERSQALDRLRTLLACDTLQGLVDLAFQGVDLTRSVFPPQLLTSMREFSRYMGWETPVLIATGWKDDCLHCCYFGEHWYPGSAVRLSGGVAVFCDPCSYPKSLLRTVNVPGFAAAIGVHPRHVPGWSAAHKEAFKILMRSPNTKALGEIGLDLTARGVKKQEEILQYLLRGFADPSRPLFFEEHQKQGLRAVPVDRLLLETDSPNLPTVGRGVGNTPHHVGDVAMLVSQVRQQPVLDVIELVNANLKRLFRLQAALRRAGWGNGHQRGGIQTCYGFSSTRPSTTLTHHSCLA
ncbi:tatd family mg-dependent DNAse [Plakobranchus ocellatus]|uniref:Tatd family mg-dependent DNAse n=1 Tax=Plakobranchus ocellatus TaxID=259542 RepID=A0AAV4CFT6_9GAST|nr:tatd family mg-dependent DNAse [Plakobranchus ocellatus]